MQNPQKISYLLALLALLGTYPMSWSQDQRSELQKAIDQIGPVEMVLDWMFTSKRIVLPHRELTPYIKTPKSTEPLNAPPLQVTRTPSKIIGAEEVPAYIDAPSSKAQTSTVGHLEPVQKFFELLSRANQSPKEASELLKFIHEDQEFKALALFDFVDQPNNTDHISYQRLKLHLIQLGNQESITYQQVLNYLINAGMKRDSGAPFIDADIRAKWIKCINESLSDYRWNHGDIGPDNRGDNFDRDQKLVAHQERSLWLIGLYSSQIRWMEQMYLDDPSSHSLLWGALDPLNNGLVHSLDIAQYVDPSAEVTPFGDNSEDFREDLYEEFDTILPKLPPQKWVDFFRMNGEGGFYAPGIEFDVGLKLLTQNIERHYDKDFPDQVVKEILSDWLIQYELGRQSKVLTEAAEKSFFQLVLKMPRPMQAQLIGQLRYVFKYDD